MRRVPLELLAKAARRYLDGGDPQIELAFAPRHEPLTASDFPASADPGSPTAAAVLALAIRVDRVPHTTGDGRWTQGDDRLSDVWIEVLDRALLARADLDDTDARALEEASSHLYVDASRTEPTVDFRAYQEISARLNDAREERATLDGAAAADTDEDGTARKRAELSDRIESIRAEWDALGAKDRVEAALATLTRLSRTSLHAAWASARTEAVLAEREGPGGGRYLSTTYLPVSFDPRDDNTWGLVVESAADGSHSDPGLGADTLVGLTLPKGDLLEAELALLEVDRGWFDPGLLDDRRWRWPDEQDEPLSDGGELASGRLPGYVHGLLVARRLSVVRSSTEPIEAAFHAESPSVPDPLTGTNSNRRRRFDQEMIQHGLEVRGTRVVQVVDDGGSAIVGARVTLSVVRRVRANRPNRPRARSRTQRHVLALETDRNGRAALPDLWEPTGREQREWKRAGRLHVAAEGHGELGLTSADERTRVTLPRLGSFRVTVTTRLPLSGHELPVEGARVQLLAPDGGNEFLPGRVFSARSGPDGVVEGRFPFPDVSSDKLVVTVDAEGYEIEASSRLREQSPVAEGGHVNLEVVLRTADPPPAPDPNGSCRVIGYFVRRLPKLPNPDPSADWG